MNEINRAISIVGFGSQGSVWAECLRDQGWHVGVYLDHIETSSSAARARELGFDPQPLSELTPAFRGCAHRLPLVALLCPDEAIPYVYDEYLKAIKRPICLILAHGFVVYANALKPRIGHEVALFAPKAIGPMLRDAFCKAFAERKPHDLLAATCFPPEASFILDPFVEAMGFQKENCVSASFEQETVGDLISEQVLLCGGVFYLLQKSIEAMSAQGIPPRLIQQECISELNLIAQLLEKRGLVNTFQKISSAAQCGAIDFSDRMKAADIDVSIKKSVDSISNRDFAKHFLAGEWKEKRNHYLNDLEKLQGELP